LVRGSIGWVLLVHNQPPSVAFSVVTAGLWCAPGQRHPIAPRSFQAMKKSHPLLLLRPLLWLVLAVSAMGARAQMPEITLTIAGHKLTAEVAATNPERMQGLMHRRMMPENRGMLFVFTEVSRHAMWMENTYIPLSVAFIDSDGVIANIEDMKPHTRDAHPAVKPVRYALEMNLGWFAKRGIKPGAKIEGLDKAPAPK
jgi:uncharacterized membrane protein (UPF0127 family)